MDEKNIDIPEIKPNTQPETGESIVFDQKPKSVLEPEGLNDYSQAAEVKKEYQLLAEKLQAEQKKLKSQIAGLVMDTTRSVLSDTLSSQDQQSIIKKQIAQLKTISIPKA